jgi:ATP-dependent helicase Lhr and Lhr-like helicase
MFPQNLQKTASLVAAHFEMGLADLLARGFITCDSFGALRQMITPPSRRRSALRPVGRWSCLRTVPPSASEDELNELAAKQLLRRTGVVFRRTIAREKLPVTWSALTRVYRRMELRGEIRGGRFVAGFSGEQFALPDAVATLREVRRQPACGALVSLSGADPLNLAGILTPGPRLAALTGNRLLYRDGVPIALLAAGEVQFLETLDAASEWAAHKALLRSAVPGPPIAPAAPAPVTPVPNA